MNSEPLDTIMEDELVDGGEQGRVADEEGDFDDEAREKYSNNEIGVEHETRSDVKEGDSGEVVANKGDMGKAPLGEDFEGQDGSSSSQGLNFRPGKIAKEYTAHVMLKQGQDLIANRPVFAITCL